MIPISPEEALSRGWNVIPVHANKRPAIPSWKQFQRERVSIDQVKQWKNLEPSGWAVITGAINSLMVIDFDGDAGNQTLKRLGLSPHIKTGSGGYHVYIEHPGFKVPTLNGKTKEELGRLYPGVDIRADGGYAIFSGVNKAGEYETLRPPNPDPFESLPADLRALLKPESDSTSPDHKSKVIVVR